MTFAIIASAGAPEILDGRPAVEPSAVLPNLTRSDFLRFLAPDRVGLGSGLDLHHVRGRLRFKAEALKKNAAKLEAICDELAAVLGVHSAAEGNLVLYCAVLT